jgi:glycosyltransferase domain-containing protein
MTNPRVMTSKLIDVIIPTYNRLEYLKLSLKSALEQDFFSFNVIVVDSNSNDGTREYLSSIKNDNFYYQTYDDNKGLFGNVNRALQHAKSEYISLFHDDDLMMPDFLKSHYDVFQDNPDVVMSHCAVVEINSAGDIIRERQKSILNGVVDKDVFLENLLKVPEKVSIVAPTVVFKKEVIDAGEFFDDRMIFWADLEYWIRLSKYGNVSYVNKVLMKYRIHDESGSTTVLKGSFMDRLRDRLLLESDVKKDLVYRDRNNFKNRRLLNSLIGSRLVIDLFYEKKYSSTIMNYFKSLFCIIKFRPNTFLNITILLKIIVITVVPWKLLMKVKN